MSKTDNQHSPADGAFTLAVLVDALRPDYVRPQWMPFLSEMVGSSATGTLRECFGFVVARAAYFAGLSTEEYGFTNMYCFDPGASPFGVARALPNSGDPHSMRAFIDQSACERMSPFAKAYGNSAEIPLPYLPFFDLTEKQAPWDAAFEHRSLFDVLNDSKKAWHQSSWPETNRLADPSDIGTVQHTLDSLTSEHRFAYVHLQQLDSIGHCFGPNSMELQKALAEVDGLCRKLIESLREHYAKVNVVLFGDHGMVNVTRTLDVQSVLEQLDLQFGIDYAYFLDSTMVRFWFFHQSARRKVESALQSIKGGRLLDEQAMKEYEIAECDPRNGELIFLADPGVLIFPNFFQGSGNPIKGMHGYDPDCEDNLGFFMLHEAEKNVKGDLGKIDPQVIYPILLELIGFNSADHTAVSVPEVRSGSDHNVYTQHTDIEAEKAVQAHLDQILAALTQRVGEVKAIVLTGSFGRGEGGVFQDATGRYCPVNDYDLIIVDSRDLNQELTGLGDQLARELNIDYVDLAHSNGQWENLTPTIFNYDLKYGSRVIAGNPEVLERMPSFASADFVADDPVRLLLNRMAGLLSGMNDSYLKGETISEDSSRYLINQMVKAWCAIGDVLLIQWGGYDTSYERRRKRFAELSGGAEMASELVEQVVWAYRFKCLPDYDACTCTMSDMQKLFCAMSDVLMEWIERLVDHKSSTLVDAMQAYLSFYSQDSSAVQVGNDSCRSNETLSVFGEIREPLDVPLQNLVYCVLPLLLSCIDEEKAAPAFQQVQEKLGSSFKYPNAKQYTPKHWDALRKDVVNAWFAVCH